MIIQPTEEEETLDDVIRQMRLDWHAELEAKRVESEAPVQEYLEYASKEFATHLRLREREFTIWCQSKEMVEACGDTKRCGEICAKLKERLKPHSDEFVVIDTSYGTAKRGFKFILKLA